MSLAVYPIRAMGKPRQTQRDQWQNRPRVARYRTFKDDCRIWGVALDLERFYHVVFVLPMPESWPARKRAEHAFQLHRAKPDKDNLEKALLDAVHGEDMRAADGRVTKVWGTAPAIIIADHDIDLAPAALAELLATVKPAEPDPRALVKHALARPRKAKRRPSRWGKAWKAAAAARSKK